MDGTLGLVLKASSRKEGARTFVTVRRLSCDMEVHTPTARRPGQAGRPLHDRLQCLCQMGG
jgi:hypothetical protein